MFIAMLGGTSSYSGQSTMTFVKHTRRQRGGQQKQGWNYHPQRTMYINDPRKGEQVESIESAVLNKFGYSLPFKLVTN